MSDTPAGQPRSPRTLVLCFDGTSNEYEEENTNVVKFFSLLKKDNFDDQICYYQTGIGTFFAPGVVSPLMQWIAKIADEAIAWYLDAHVMDGYRFLMQNYRVGDKICMFGFSRGAYTARALGGMLYKVGLLPRDNQEQIPFAYKLYKREDESGITLSAGFKKAFCHTVQIEFIGVWDTVASVGVIMSKNLPFTSSNRAVKTFRHALSLDEHRARFKPNLYHRPAPGDTSVDIEQAADHRSSGSSKAEKRWSLQLFRRKKKSIPFELSAAEKAWSEADVLEVWFAGSHSDVGGGDLPNDAMHCLSDIPLRWMVRQVVESTCGVIFLDGVIDALHIYPPSPPTPGLDPTVDEEDAVNAIQPIHDQLVLQKLWWLLEILPTKYSCQDADGVWRSSFAWNLGRGRVILEKEPKFHITVKARMNEKSLNYIPKAQWDSKQVYVN